MRNRIGNGLKFLDWTCANNDLSNKLPDERIFRVCLEDLKVLKVREGGYLPWNIRAREDEDAKDFERVESVVCVLSRRSIEGHPKYSIPSFSRRQNRP